MTDLGLKIANPERLQTALKLVDYDAHSSADALREKLGPLYAPVWADWIDDAIEWLSVVRDGLNGMDFDERFVASITRCAKHHRPARSSKRNSVGE